MTCEEGGKEKPGAHFRDLHAADIYTMVHEDNQRFKVLENAVISNL